MHIGLIGGIGPAATDHYYSSLIRALADRKKALELTIVHADAPTLLANLARGDERGQAVTFLRLAERLQAAGAEAMAVTSIAGHFCIEELNKSSPLPLIDLIGSVDKAMVGRKLKKVGLIGTNKVMESRFYGSLPSVEIVIPSGPELQQVHQSYVDMAMSGAVTEPQRQVFYTAGRRLCDDHCAEAVMLGGTDLFLAFDGRECGFEIVDCAGIHIKVLAAAAAGEK